MDGKKKIFPSMAAGSRRAVVGALWDGWSVNDGWDGVFSSWQDADSGPRREMGNCPVEGCTL